MSAQDFRTAVEGQLYILKNASSESQFVDSIQSLLNIRNRLEQYSTNQHASIKSLIDANIQQTLCIASKVNPCVECVQSRSIDDRIDDVIDSVCSTNTIATFTGFVLSAFYGYAYYAWFYGI